MTARDHLELAKAAAKAARDNSKKHSPTYDANQAALGLIDQAIDRLGKV